MRGTSIRVFLVDGDPNGLRVIEKSNWTGVVLVAPRSLLAALRARPEVLGPGAYLLVGPRQDGGTGPDLYVGEADEVGRRLGQQTAQEFWTQAIVMTSKDTSLNKAHVRWLEARLIDLARAAGRSNLRNGNAGAPVRLSEADQADMEAFLDEALVVLPLVGLQAFNVPTAPPVGHRDAFHLRGQDTRATGYDQPDGFLVVEGAVGRQTMAASAVGTWIETLRSALAREGLLVTDNGRLRLTRNYTFASPSAAAAALLGRTANGRVEWKTSDGRALRTVQDESSTAPETDQPPSDHD